MEQLTYRENNSKKGAKLRQELSIYTNRDNYKNESDYRLAIQEYENYKNDGRGTWYMRNKKINKLITYMKDKTLDTMNIGSGKQEIDYTPYFL